MIRKPKHATTNYRMLKPFLDATDEVRGHKRFTAAGYMDLVVENLQITDGTGGKVYSITHYGVQNGDAMRDPDMELIVDDTNKTIIPRTFRNDYMGVFHEVFRTFNGKRYYSQRLLTDLDGFLWQWLHNITEQGFLPV